MKTYKVTLRYVFSAEIEARNETEANNLIDSNLPDDYSPSIHWFTDETEVDLQEIKSDGII